MLATHALNVCPHDLQLTLIVSSAMLPPLVAAPAQPVLEIAGGLEGKEKNA